MLTVFVVCLMHSALYLSMKDPEKGIKELKLEKDKKVFNHCFTGKEILSCCFFLVFFSLRSIKRAQG